MRATAQCLALVTILLRMGDAEARLVGPSSVTRPEPTQPPAAHRRWRDADARQKRNASEGPTAGQPSKPLWVWTYTTELVWSFTQPTAWAYTTQVNATSAGYGPNSTYLPQVTQFPPFIVSNGSKGEGAAQSLNVTASSTSVTYNVGLGLPTHSASPRIDVVATPVIPLLQNQIGPANASSGRPGGSGAANFSSSSGSGAALQGSPGQGTTNKTLPDCEAGGPKPPGYSHSKRSPSQQCMPKPVNGSGSADGSQGWSKGSNDTNAGSGSGSANGTDGHTAGQQQGNVGAGKSPSDSTDGKYNHQAAGSRT